MIVVHSSLSIAYLLKVIRNNDDYVMIGAVSFYKALIVIPFLLLIALMVSDISKHTERLARFRC